MANVSRRNFLKASGFTAAMVAGQGSLFAKTDVIKVENAKDAYSNASFTENHYRDEFTFTYGEKSDHGYAYHCVNCQGNCAWEVWGNNGVVTRENQSAKYPAFGHNPDFNPRGCNKGVQHSQVMYEKDRILYPMKRVGERGKGKWKRVSWDEAATEVAQKLYTTMIDPKKGPAAITVHAGTGLLTEGRRPSVLRFGTQLGASRIYPASYLGDMFTGAAVAFGEGNVGCTYDFMFNVTTSIMWGANPSATRIPDAHFVWEGKYNGSKIIVITPEFNASAARAHLWVPIKPGTDSYLAMSIINDLLVNKLYAPQAVKTYTDLPFLVDVQTKRFIRRSDVEHTNDKALHHKYEDEFYCWNLKSGKPELMPGTEGSDRKTLILKDKTWDIDPALEGVWEMTLHGGKKVKVTTVFELLKKEAAKFPASETQKITGVHPSVVSELATHIGKDKCVDITTGFSLNKYFNGILSVWNIATICGLTGRYGPRGGLNTENEFQLSGMETLSGFAGKYSPRFASGFLSEFMMGDGMKTFNEYFDDSDVKRGMGINKKEYVAIVNKMIEEGKEATKAAKSVNGGRGKPFWIPEVAILCADSRFRRNKGDLYREEFLKNVKYFTYIDYRMSDAAVYADLLLPAKSHYEVWDLRSSPGYHRFTNLAQPLKNIKPVGESKDEWAIMSLIAQKLEEIAKKGPVQKVADPGFTKNGYRELDKFYAEYTNHDEESEGNQEPYLGSDKEALEAALKNCPQYEPYTIEKMYAMGGFLTLNQKAGKTAPLYPNKPYNMFENMLYKFERFETLTGRQCCYVDMPLWIELGCATNTARDNIRPNNKKYPFALLTPHARWSIHTNYKNSKTLQRLQRGMPYVAVNKDVAAIKGVKDGDIIRVYNQLGEFQANAKVSSSVAPDNVVMEDGWEPYWFKSLKGYNTVVPASLNLQELSGGWGHLKFGGLWDGNQYAYDGAINFEKAKA